MTLILFLILAPIVAFLGYMISWVNKSNNPFWVYRQLKKLSVGDEWWAKGSPDMLPEDSPLYRPHHRTVIVTAVKVSFWRGRVAFEERLDGKPTGWKSEYGASSFFAFHIPDNR